MPPLRHPIVLVHGLGGFDAIRLALASREAFRIEYFRAVPAILTEAGAPRVLLAALPPTRSVRDRAKALAVFVDREIPDGPFHLIAHSMGGLDSRDYLTHLGGAGRALSLVTLGTPHRGSPLATRAHETLLRRVKQVAARLVNRTRLRRFLRATAAQRDLRPDVCARFNARTPDAPAVRYFSWAGEPTPASLHWALAPTHRALGEPPDGGPNDGLVPTASAQWTGWRGAVPTDHLGLVGWQSGPAARKAFDVADFYQTLLEDLRQVESEKERE